MRDSSSPTRTWGAIWLGFSLRSLTVGFMAVDEAAYVVWFVFDMRDRRLVNRSSDP